MESGRHETEWQLADPETPPSGSDQHSQIHGEHGGTDRAWSRGSGEPAGANGGELGWGGVSAGGRVCLRGSMPALRGA